MQRPLQFHLVSAVVILAAAAGLMSAYLQSAASSPAEPPTGSPVDGLQLSLTLLSAKKGTSPMLQVALHNKGEKDANVNLGMMLANNKIQLPTRLHLLLTDPQNQTNEYEFFDGRYPGIVGRVDDYIVPLRSGTTYSLQVKLNQFMSMKGKERKAPTAKLTPGRYQLVAQFEGGGAETDNADMPGIKLISLWRGKLLSNKITLKQ